MGEKFKQEGTKTSETEEAFDGEEHHSACIARYSWRSHLDLAEQMKGNSQTGQEEAGNEPGVTEGRRSGADRGSKGDTTTEAGQGDGEHTC